MKPSHLRTPRSAEEAVWIASDYPFDWQRQPRSLSGLAWAAATVVAVLFFLAVVMRGMP